jgi:Cu2+-containing amine oxidase
MTRSWIAVLVLATLAPLTGSGCVKRCCVPATPAPPPASPFEVVQEFPSPGPSETGWKVHWADGPGKGLYITGAWFRRVPGETWIRILYDARLADIFVPYEPGSPRYYDLSQFNFGLIDANARDAGCCGTLLGSPPRIVKEVRDRGPLWKDDQAVRRGQELVLWGTIDAGNYNYIVQYAFRDDGSIGFRLGATAQNLPGMEHVSHMHNGLWRIDVDLAGAAHDSALVMRHLEPTGSLTASDRIDPFAGGREGGIEWDAKEFTEISIKDTAVVNSHGRPIMYDLMPLRPGSARHLEAFSHKDLWVTRYRGTELIYADLPTYVADLESVSDTDVVLWYISPMHHMPRDEDGEKVGGMWKGSALVMWSGFDLRPRNLFSETPLHP